MQTSQQLWLPCFTFKEMLNSDSNTAIRVAQRKRGGPITHRSQDRNLALICFCLFFFFFQYDLISRFGFPPLRFQFGFCFSLYDLIFLLLYYTHHTSQSICSCSHITPHNRNLNERTISPAYTNHKLLCDRHRNLVTISTLHR